MNDKANMTHREFIKKGLTLTAVLIISIYFGTSCDNINDFPNSGTTTCTDTGTLTRVYSCTALTNGKSWSNYQQAVAIGASGLGYDSTSATNPTVIKDGSTYKMWYTGSNGTRRIIYCESSDGVNWSNYQLAVNISASGLGYDTIHAQNPTVIKDGSTYKMWYGGNNGFNRIIYCESSDGVNWSNFQLAVNKSAQGTYDVTDSDNPAVIKDGSVYKMWYSGSDSSKVRILYSESSDGVNWSNFQLAVDFGASGLGYDSTWSQNPTVIKDGSVYKMWYSGYNGTWQILYCESSDGVNWSNYQLSVDISSSGTGLDTTTVGSPTVVNESGVGKMWYNTNSGGVFYSESS